MIVRTLVRTLVTACVVAMALPLQAQITLEPLPIKPDYAKISYWAAHPDILDGSDRRYAASAVMDAHWAGSHPLDIPTFFVYPTLYEAGPTWNANVLDVDYRRGVNATALTYQASVFNALGPVWSPHYRQMMYRGYFPEAGDVVADIQASYDSAYADVARAFQQFLMANPEGPFILAGHSQGTGHAVRLLREVVTEDKNLQQRLLVAFLVGHTVTADDVNGFPLCENPLDVNCWVGWRSYGKDFYPSWTGEALGVVNPITWTTSPERSKRWHHQGGLYTNGSRILRRGVTARVHDGTLRIEKHRFPLGWFFRWEDYHRADYNLFWFNIRENLHLRASVLQGQIVEIVP